MTNANGGTVTVTITGKDDLSKVLGRLQKQLEAADKAATQTADRTSKALQGLAGGASRAASAAETSARSIATQASAMARLQSASGNAAGAQETLRAAIARLNSDSVESIRLQTQLANSVNRLSSAKGPTVLPRTIAGLSHEAAAAVTRFATLGVALGGLSAAFSKASEGFNLKAQFDQNRGAFNVLIGDVGKANQAFAAGSQFAQKYAFTQTEIAGALRTAAPLLKSTTASTEEALGVLARLAQLNPAQGLEGATVALRELASGDIVSLVERFNVSRQAANAMKAEILAGGDALTIFGKYLDNSGAGLELLEQRTVGAAGALNEYKKAQDDLSLALGEFVAGPGASFLGFLTQVAQNATAGFTLPQQVADLRAQAAAGAATWTEYQAAAAAAGTQLEGLGLRGQALAAANVALSQSQFAYFQALQQSGVAAGEAFTAAQNLRGEQAALAEAIVAGGTAASLSAEQIAGLVGSMTGIAAASSDSGAQMAALAATFAEGGISAESLLAIIAQLSAEQAANAAAAQQAEAASAALTAQRQGEQGATEGATAATAENTASLYDNAVTKAIAAAEAQALAIAEQELTAAAQAAAGGLLTNEAAAASLAAQFGIDYNEALRLISGLRELAAEAANAENAVAKALNRAARGGGGGSSVGNVTKPISDLERLRRTLAAPSGASGGAAGRRRSGGGGGGGGGGASTAAKEAAQREKVLSDAEQKREEAARQHQQRLEDASASHEQKLTDIAREYAEKRQEAEEKYSQNQLDGRAGFYAGLADLATSSDKGDQELAKSLSAQYEAAAQEAAQIAATKGADVADAYLKAQQDAIQGQGRIQQDINTALAEGDKGKAEYLRGVLQAQQAADNERLRRIKEGQDSLAQQQQAAYGAEEAAYQAHLAQMLADYQRTLAEMERAYQEKAGALGLPLSTSAAPSSGAVAASGGIIDRSPQNAGYAAVPAGVSPQSMAGVLGVRDEEAIARLGEIATSNAQIVEAVRGLGRVPTPTGSGGLS